ncbi:MAG: hypothetical protein NC306_08290 [Butyrivibrio sp.]|nr:hypothetical protein [Butyrivibrio sp.]
MKHLKQTQNKMPAPIHAQTFDPTKKVETFETNPGQNACAIHAQAFDPTKKVETFETDPGQNACAIHAQAFDPTKKLKHLKQTQNKSPILPAITPTVGSPYQPLQSLSTQSGNIFPCPHARPMEIPPNHPMGYHPCTRPPDFCWNFVGLPPENPSPGYPFPGHKNSREAHGIRLSGCPPLIGAT